MGGQSANKLVHAICAITDPFCHGAEGSKYPDSASIKTLTWDSEYYGTASTDATGRAAIIIGADPASQYSIVSTWSGATMTIATSTAPSTAPSWSAWSGVTGVSYRVVSLGVELRCISSAMTNQGSIGIAVLPSTVADMTTIGIDLDSMNFASNVRVSANSGQSLAAISYNDGITSKVMKATSAAPVNRVTSYGNDTMFAYIVGGPASTAAIQVRIVAHYELAFSSSTVFNTLATPSALENGTVQTGSNFVKKALDQVVVGGAKEVERRVHNTATHFGGMLVRMGASAIGGYFGGPAGAIAAGGAAGMIMDVD